ncbi:MAG: hypothetical protein HOO91_17800 [Bacteroidales bacterium]|nr:hypothetical protein [Bacteroidales bacterium]
MDYKKIAQTALMRGGGGAAGGALAVGAEILVEKFIPGKLSPTVMFLGEILLGAIIPEFNTKMKILDHVGAGMSGAGGASLMRNIIYPMPTPTKVSGTDDEMLSGIGETFYPTDTEKVNSTNNEFINTVEETLGNTSDESIEINGTSFLTS